MKKENENLPQITNQNGLINIEIPEETINLVASMADENAVWPKLTDGGFLLNEKVIPELKGVLAAIRPYYVKWTNKKPEKIPFNGQEAPEGFELKCDIRLNVKGTVIGLSLAKTSIKAHLSPYLKFLKNSGLKPYEVITRIRSKAVSSSHGKFNVAIFDCCGTVVDIPESTPIQEEQPIIDVGTIKETPQPVHPWA